jgi:hypothetical protein
MEVLAGASEPVAGRWCTNRLTTSGIAFLGAVDSLGTGLISGQLAESLDGATACVKLHAGN